MQPLDETPFGDFVPAQFGIKLAREAWERRAHHALRRAVFCREQGLFAGDDRDAIDAVAIPIVAVSFVMGSAFDVLGTVRIHSTGDGLWLGSRLAIDARFRSVHGLGSALVDRAVATARGRGCERFDAHVQVQNVAFFERLGWTRTGTVTLCERPHAAMRAPLEARAALDDDTVAILRARRAS